MSISPAFYTVTATAQRLSCSRSKVWRLLRAKTFTSTKLGGTVVIPSDQVEAFVADLMAECGEPAEVR
jgi:excisionase family DNA binding protein